MKTCTKCGETKPEAEFSKDSHRPDGLRTSCRACNKIANAKWRADNPDKEKSRGAKRYADNPDREKARHAKWVQNNRAELRLYNANIRAENPEAHRIRLQNRRARKLAAGGKLSSGLSDRLFKLQRGKCACGCKQPLGTDYHLDHIMPLTLGGTNTDDNIQLLTATCNQQKHAKHPVDFMQQRGFLL